MATATHLIAILSIARPGSPASGWESKYCYGFLADLEGLRSPKQGKITRYRGEPLNQDGPFQASPKVICRGLSTQLPILRGSILQRENAAEFSVPAQFWLPLGSFGRNLTVGETQDNRIQRVAFVEQLARNFKGAAAAKDILEKVHQKINCATDKSQRYRESLRWRISTPERGRSK